jgi:hypothetical protein
MEKAQNTDSIGATIGFESNDLLISGRSVQGQAQVSVQDWFS